MARFQAPARHVPGVSKTTNFAGSEAYSLKPREELANLVLNSLVQDTFYESAKAQLDRLNSITGSLAANGDLLFAAKAAIFARKEYGLRSISHALAVDVADYRYTHPDQRGDWGARFFEKVIFRADDMAQIAAYWLSRHGGKRKTLPSAMKRGFARKLQGTKEHLLAKWDGGSAGLTLRQLAHLVHPKGAKDSAIYRLRGGNLAKAETHEVRLTEAGKSENKAEAKAQAWGDLLAKGRLKYVAAMRSAKRIINDAPEAVPALCEKLTNLEDIRGSKVFPTQILVAQLEVSREGRGPLVRKVVQALGQAIELSVENVPELEGDTLVAVDDSGSMNWAPSKILGCSPAQIAAFMAAVLYWRNDGVDLMHFAGTANYFTPRGRSFDSVMETTLSKIGQGGMTNLRAVVDRANTVKAYDRVIVISDQEAWVGGRVPKPFKGNPWVFSWNLCGSPTAQFPAHRRVNLAGFSDKVLDLMKLAETDPQAMINAIDRVTI